jgi:hypothetical protein
MGRGGDIAEDKRFNGFKTVDIVEAVNDNKEHTQENKGRGRLPRVKRLWGFSGLAVVGPVVHYI